MAIVNPVLISQPFDGQSWLFEWAAMNNGDTIGWLKLPAMADKTVHMWGTFGGAVTVEGTLEDGVPSNPFVLNDSRGEGNPLNFTATDGREIMEHVIQIRPNPGAGVTNTTARLLLVRTG